MIRGVKYRRIAGWCAFIMACQLFVVPAFAQREAWNWHFGWHRALSFNRDSVWSVPDSVYNWWEGGGAYSDYDGRLVLFSDGLSVFDKTQKRAPYPDMRSFYSATQSGLIIRRPGSLNRFYILNNQDTSVRPPIPDYFLTLWANKVRVDPLNRSVTFEVKDSLLARNTTEKVCAIHHANGRDIWVIQHTMKRDTLRARLLTESGFDYGSTATSRAGPVWDKDGYGMARWGAMKVSSTGRFIFAANNSMPSALYSFDRSTGQVKYQLSLPKPDTTGLMVMYGCEFSLDERYLYVSFHREYDWEGWSSIRQYDLSEPDSVKIVNTCVILDSLYVKYNKDNPRVSSFTSLQMAPNGRIYVEVVNDSMFIGEIQAPNNKGLDCRYRRIDLGLYNRGGMNFPSFVSTAFNPRSFDSEGYCHGNTTRFRASEMRRNDSVRWCFDDTLSHDRNLASGDTTNHVFTAPGDYWVRAELFFEGRIDTVTQLIRIYPPPRIVMPSRLAVCPGVKSYIRPQVVGGRPGFHYYWSPKSPVDRIDDAVDTVLVTSPAQYTLTVYDDNDCFDQQSIWVVPDTASFTLTSHTRDICLGDSTTPDLQLADTLHPPTFQWSPSDGVSDVTSAFPALAPLQTTRYAITATDSVGCVTTDTILVRVHAPAVLSMPDTVHTCAGGAAHIDAIASGAEIASMQWSPTAGLSSSDTLSVTAQPDSTTTYSLIVRTIQGCISSAQITVHVRPEPRAAITGPDTVCANGSVIWASAYLYDRYEWRGSNGTILGTDPSLSLQQPDTVTLQVWDGFGCTREIRRVLTRVPSPPVPVITRTIDTLHAGVYDNYQWYRDGVPIVGATSAYVFLDSTGVYGVRVGNRYGCTAMSDTMYCTARPVIALSMMLPDLSAAPGERVDIPITVTSTDPSIKSLGRNVVARMRLDRSILAPIGVTPSGVFQGEDRVIDIDVEASDHVSPLAVTHFIAMLGPKVETPLRIDSVWSDDAILRAQLIPGRFTLRTCQEGGTRLFDADGAFTLKQNQPNPFNAETEIEYTVLERAPAELAVMDALGRRVTTLASGMVEPGAYRVRFDASALPSGVYTCVLHAGVLVKTIRMVVVK